MSESTWPLRLQVEGVDPVATAARVREIASVIRPGAVPDPLGESQRAVERIEQLLQPGAAMSALALSVPIPGPAELRDRYHIHELCALHDVAFLNSAYRCILGRVPTSNDLWPFLDALRHGRMDRVEVVSVLIRSQEGRCCGAARRVRGWRWRWLLRVAAKQPVVGLPVRFALALASLPASLQRLRVVEAQHHALVSDCAHLVAVLRQELLEREQLRRQRRAEADRALLGALRSLPAFGQAAPPVATSRRPRVAFVVPRCGADVVGGAEALGFTLARTMAGMWEVEVLSSCAKDYTTWADHYPAGEDRRDGITVRRFPVAAPRDVLDFNRMYDEAVRSPETIDGAKADRWMRAQGSDCPGLVDHLRTHGRDYDAVFFTPYLYATTWFGVPEVADRAVLVPCAHDEPPLRFRCWRAFMRRPAAWLFMTEEELGLMRARFPDAAVDGPIAAQPIEEPDDVSADRFRAAYGITRPFLLYLGRIEESKGCHDLFRAYLAMRQAWPEAPDLVLVGKQNMAIPADPGVRYLGFVPDRDRWDAIAATAAVLNPSPYESLSLVLLEAWALARPTVANAHCAVLAGQTARSGCGRVYGDDAGFAAAVREVVAHPGLAAGGPAFVRDRYGRARVRGAMQECLDRIMARRRQGAAS